jgi:hypothetical protein
MAAGGERAQGFRRIGFLDLPGGGQVVVAGRHAYVGHMAPPHGTSIIDVSEPASPRLVSQVTVPGDVHSHKVRVLDDLMLVNYERFPPGDATKTPATGLKIFDVSDRSHPREVTFFRTHGRGVHRFDLQGHTAFISTEWEGFRSNILLILDLSNPLRPSVVGQWWLPGQHAAGGEEPPNDLRHYWVHLALARGDRVYAACGRAGAWIVDISDPHHPAALGGATWNPPYALPAHTFLPLARPIGSRRFAVVADEDVTDDVLEEPPAFMWVLDITSETHPVPVATYHVDPAGLAVPGRRFGAHQPWERIRDDNMVFLAWFSGGVRAVDVSNPYAPREAGYYVPSAPEGESVPQTNDIFVDDRGLVYAVDRYRGLSILEFIPNTGGSVGRAHSAAAPRGRRPEPGAEPARR